MGESSSVWEAGRSKLTANRVVGNPFSVEAAWMHDPINAPFPLRESIETLARGNDCAGFLKHDGEPK